MLKPIAELRQTSFEIASKNLQVTTVGELSNWIVDKKVDFNVYLHSYQMELQRPFCWSLEQKRELILSILIGRPIPPIVLVSQVDANWENERYLVIDGKQRLSCLVQFVNNEFSVLLEGEAYTYERLKVEEPEYGRCVDKHPIISWMAYDLTEDQIVEWFLRLNFAGTPQDANHKDKLLEGKKLG